MLIDFYAQIAWKGVPLEEFAGSFPCKCLHFEMQRSLCLNIDACSQMSLMNIRFIANSHIRSPPSLIQDHVQQSPHSLSSSVLVPNSDRAPPARWEPPRPEMAPTSCHCIPSLSSPASAFTSQIHITRFTSQ
jgi:hypothetical protein